MLEEEEEEEEEAEACPLTLAVSRREVKGETFQHGALRAKQGEHKSLKRRRTRFSPQTAADLSAFLGTVVFSVIRALRHFITSLRQTRGSAPVTHSQSYEILFIFI